MQLESTTSWPTMQQLEHSEVQDVSTSGELRDVSTSGELQEVSITGKVRDVSTKWRALRCLCKVAS